MLTDLAPGTVLGDDFRVVAPLSRGGMGAVYIVEQISTNKRRALKLMLEARTGDAEMRRRFAQEARVGSLVASEHVVDVIAAGVDAKTGVPWLAMELLEGEDLATYSERRTVLAPAEVAEIFAQLCHALGAAHDIPVVHRDLKPGNVFLARPRLSEARFVLKVLDFGIAKIMTSDASTTKAVGTPLWMAPEQTQAGANISPATDVWALGLIAFRLLTGRLYWKGANELEPKGIVVMREILFDALAPASVRARELGGAALPAGFDEWFAHTVVRDPSVRFANARAAWAALGPILGSTSKTNPVQVVVPATATGNGPASAVGELSATVSAQTPPPAPPTGPAPHATLDAVGNTLGDGAAAIPLTRSSRQGWALGLGAGAVAIGLAVALLYPRMTGKHTPTSPSGGASSPAPPPQPPPPPTQSATPEPPPPAAAPVVAVSAAPSGPRSVRPAPPPAPRPPPGPTPLPAPLPKPPTPAPAPTPSATPVTI